MADDLAARYDAQYTATSFTTAMFAASNIAALAAQLTHEIKQLYAFYGYPEPDLVLDDQYREDVYQFVLKYGYRFTTTAHANEAFVRNMCAPLTAILRDEKQHASRLCDARTNGRSETYLRQYSSGIVSNPAMEQSTSTLRTADWHLSHPHGNQPLPESSMTKCTSAIDPFAPRL